MAGQIVAAKDRFGLFFIGKFCAFYVKTVRSISRQPEWIFYL